MANFRTETGVAHLNPHEYPEHGEGENGALGQERTCGWGENADRGMDRGGRASLPGVGAESPEEDGENPTRKPWPQLEPHAGVLWPETEVSLRISYKL